MKPLKNVISKERNSKQVGKNAMEEEAECAGLRLGTRRVGGCISSVFNISNGK